MTFERFCELMPDMAEKITNEQAACCKYLERKGKRFLVDFGFENAPDMVWSELDSEYVQ